jgi:hypothetical protein
MDDHEIGLAIGTMTEAALVQSRREAQRRKPQPQRRDVSNGEACGRMVESLLPHVARESKKLAKRRAEIIKHGGESLAPSNITKE